MDKTVSVTDEPRDSLRVSVKDYVANLMERYRHIVFKTSVEIISTIYNIYRVVSRMTEEEEEAERRSASMTAAPNDSQRKSVEVYVAKLMER